MLTIEIHTAGAEAALTAAGRAVGDTLPLMQVLQRRGVVEVKRHFLARNGEGNRRGWPQAMPCPWSGPWNSSSPAGSGTSMDWA